LVDDRFSGIHSAVEAQPVYLETHTKEVTLPLPHERQTDEVPLLRPCAATMSTEAVPNHIPHPEAHSRANLCGSLCFVWRPGCRFIAGWPIRLTLEDSVPAFL
jgi:hypothetical protein